MNRQTTTHLLPPKPEATALFRGFLGGFIAIMGLLLLTSLTQQPLLMAPFGATCVLLFAASSSPLAQPRNVIGGHLVSAFIGLIALQVFGDHDIVIAASIGLAIVAMQYFRVVHPPAGANPLVIFLSSTSTFDFLVFPVLLGSIGLVAIATLINNIGKSSWPTYWYGHNKH